MKTRNSLIIKTALALVLSLCVLSGSMVYIFASDLTPRTVGDDALTPDVPAIELGNGTEVPPPSAETPDEGETTPSLPVDPETSGDVTVTDPSKPVTQEQLAAKFAEYTYVSEENGKKVVTIYSADQIAAINARRAAGEQMPMSNDEVFEVGGTYRYRAFIVRKDEATDAFPASAEDITVNIEGLSADCEMDVYFNSAGTVLTCDVIFVLETTISGEVTVSGSKATAKVTVENLPDGTEATLMVAQYRDGKMVTVKMASVKADGSYSLAGTFSHRTGDTYKAFLLSAENCAPLCTAATLT